MNELALFAGAGGGILAGRQLGWRTVCAVELDPYARAVLMARQDDGCLDPFPVWDDVCTFDARPWAGLVDIVSGGFPCQDISVAGRGAGIDGARSGLWREMARIVGEVRPSFVFVENSPALVTRGLGTVLGDLAALGYDAEWGVLGASDVGAPHRRQRIWILAHAASIGRREGWSESGRWQGGSAAVVGRGSRTPLDAERVAVRDEPIAIPGRSGAAVAGLDGAARTMADADGERTQVSAPGELAAEQGPRGIDWWCVEPDVGRVAHGVASRVDRLRCLGNGQVPQCAAEAWRQLTARRVAAETAHPG